MARYGARNAKWAPFAAEAADASASKLPAYGEAKTFGELNKVTDTLNFNEGSAYGDDSIALYEKKFKDGTQQQRKLSMITATKSMRATRATRRQRPKSND